MRELCVIGMLAPQLTEAASMRRWMWMDRCRGRVPAAWRTIARGDGHGQDESVARAVGGRVLRRGAWDRGVRRWRRAEYGHTRGGPAVGIAHARRPGAAVLDRGHRARVLDRRRAGHWPRRRRDLRGPQRRRDQA